MKRKNQVNWVDVPGGYYQPGSRRGYPEERDRARATVEPFRLAKHQVTNAQFGQFVAVTGYVTTAELPPDADHEPGSIVFTGSSKPISLNDHQAWWSWVPGARWNQPNGPGSSVRGRDKHPVVHVSVDDAIAYAEWIKARLPTEDEWEWAAGGNADDPGLDAPQPEDANTWHGLFPWYRQKMFGSPWLTTPVDRFQPNALGLRDMIGNVWELTSTLWTEETTGSPCCAPAINPGDVRYVQKGGSFACSPDYCRRYRAAARQARENHSTTSHTGFRVAR